MKTEIYELNRKQIRIPIAESYKDCMTLIGSDRYRLSEKKGVHAFYHHKESDAVQIFCTLLVETMSI